MDDTRTRLTSLQNSFLGKVVEYTGIYTIFYSVIAGVAHFAFDKVHLGFVNNLPDLLGYLLIAAYYFQAIMRRQVNKFMVFFGLFVVFYIIYAFGMDLSFIQALMGFYLWGYFLVGVVVTLYEKEQDLFKYLPIFWLIAVVGVLLNYFVTYPWVGDTYEVAGTTMQSARQWTAEGGITRLAGFSRISVAAAAQILLACMFMITSRRYSLLIKIVVFFVSFLAITITTSKTQMGLLAMFPFFLGTYRVLQYLWPKSRAAFNFARAVTVIWVCLVFILPLTLSTHKQANMTGAHYGFLTGETVEDRITRMWPEAFDLLDSRGNRWFGRGIGGIGTGLSMQDPLPDTVNSADNMFVYVFVECGAFGAIPFMLAFVLNLDNLYRKNERYFEIIWATGFFILGLATMQSVVEESFSAVFLGILLARGYVTPKHLDSFTIADRRF